MWSSKTVVAKSLWYVCQGMSEQKMNANRMIKSTKKQKHSQMWLHTEYRHISFCSFSGTVGWPSCKNLSDWVAEVQNYTSQQRYISISQLEPDLSGCSVEWTLFCLLTWVQARERSRIFALHLLWVCGITFLMRSLYCPFWSEWNRCLFWKIYGWLSIMMTFCGCCCWLYWYSLTSINDLFYCLLWVSSAGGCLELWRGRAYSNWL